MIYVLSKNKKNIKKILVKIFNFYNLGKYCVLHGHVPTIYVLSENMKNIQIFLMKFSIFTGEKYCLNIAWTSFRNEFLKL